MSPQSDENTRGLGVALRFAGIVVPIAAFFSLFLAVERARLGVPMPRGALSGTFRVVAFLWSWPYAMNDQEPFSFGAFALASLAMTAILLFRRDRRGGATILLLGFFVGWLLAAIIGQAQGY